MPIRKRPPPWESPRIPDIGLRWGPREVLFLMGELPLYAFTICEGKRTVFFGGIQGSGSELKIVVPSFSVVVLDKTARFFMGS